MRAIHQFVPMLHRGDAVGRHTLHLREVMAARGIRSHIYVEIVDPDTAGETRRITEYPRDAGSDDLLLYQFATASDMAPWLARRPETLVVNYHNVTPPEYYAPWDNALARHQLRARVELQELATRAALGVGVSAFNEAELRACGYRRTAAVPPAAMLATSARTAGGSVSPASEVRHIGARWACVGRAAPNKAVEDALRALLVARRHHDPEATLLVVGRPVVPAYSAALHRFAAELGVLEAVTFAGALRDDQLRTALAGCDVMVVPSRHEGFGVPVLEALAIGLPVVANDAAALPEVVGDAGLLVDAGDPYAFAGAVARVLGDAGLREMLAAAASRRLADLDLSTAADRLVELLGSL